MPRRILILVLALALTGGKSFSQSFMHSVGSTVNVLHGEQTIDGYSNSWTFALSTITYFPRYNLLEMDNSSLSVGAPVGIGFGLSRDLVSGTSAFYWGYDAPVVLDFNIGAKSTPDNNGTFGGYFGGGFGYTHSNWNFDGMGDVNATSYGPIIRAGARFGFSSSDMGLTIGLSYKIGLEAEKYRTYSLAVLLDL